VACLPLVAGSTPEQDYCHQIISSQEVTMATAIALFVVLAGALSIVGITVHALVTLVRYDGYYPRRRPSAPVSEPPRSHPADLFDPRSRAA
jgi:hypothetical protein